MSIWCSHEHIGTHPQDHLQRGGEVLSYAQGFSNHYPDLSGDYERPAVIALAHVAPWCVTGHDQNSERWTCSGCGADHEEGVEVGAWLRLEVAAPQTLDFWEKDEHGKPLVHDEGATVLLDEAAVTALRDELTAWLEVAKVRPIEDGAR